jgi:hypothetical protein
VLPEVIGLPRGDLGKQVRFGPTWSAAAVRTAYRSLAFRRPRKAH